MNRDLPGRVLIWLSGAQPRLLERAPGDRAKYQGIGGAVLTTATLAGISMFFALQMAVKASWYAALPVAVIWFFAILNLDRWLVVSIQRGQRPLLIALPRLLMALLFGFIISTPLVLQIFKPEVETEINKIRLEQTEKFQGSLTNGQTGIKIKDLQKQETDLLTTIASGGKLVNPESDPTVIALRGQLKTWTDKRDKARALVACEETGNACPNGTKKSGQGPIYRQRLAEQNDAQAEVDKLTGRLDARLNELQTASATGRDQTLREAKEALPGVQTQLRTLKKIQSDEQNAFEAANEENTGLLIRLDALNRASSGDFTLGLWRILLFLLITTIECLPIFVKVLQLFGPKSTYEEIAEDDSSRRIGIGRTLSDTDQQTVELEQGTQVTQARTLAEAREQSLKDISDLTAAAELRVAAAILAAWEAREIANIPRNIDAYVSTSQAPEPGPAAAASPTPMAPPMAPAPAPPAQPVPPPPAEPFVSPYAGAGGVTPYYVAAYDQEARRQSDRDGVFDFQNEAQSRNGHFETPPPGPPPVNDRRG